MQWQYAVAAHFSSEQLLLFANSNIDGVDWMPLANTAKQSQKTVTANFSSKQLLSFGIE